MKKSIYRLLLFLPPLVVFLPILLSGKVLYWGTPYLQFYPWQAEAFAQLQQGVFPWWNPWSGAGAPLAANYQAGIFYPPNWLLYPFYSIGGNAWGAWANTLVLLLHAWIGAFGMARLARQQGFSELIQIISAMLLPLSGYFITRANFFPIYLAGAWLPWLLWCGQRLLEKNHRLPAFIGFSACSSLLFLAGHAQTAMMIFSLALLWILVLGLAGFSKKDTIRAIGLAGVGVIVGVLAAAVQLVPTYEYLSQSQRAAAVDYQSVFTYSFSPIKLLTLLLPDLFGNPGLGNYIGYATYWEDAIFLGIIPALLAISSLSTFKGWRKLNNRDGAIAVFSVLIIGVGLLFAFGEFTPVYPYLYRSIPGFDMFKAPARWLLLVETGLILLACLGFERMRRPAGRALFWGRLATAGAGAIAIGAMAGIALVKDLPSTILAPLLRLSAFGAAFGLLRLFLPQEKQDRRHRLWSGLVYGLIMLDLVLFAVPALPRLPMSILPNKQGDSDQYFSGRIYMAPGTEQQLKIHRFFRFSDFRPLEFVQKAAIIPLPNLNLFAQQPMLNNFDPIVPAEYHAWISALQAADPLLQSELLSISNVKSVVRLDFNLTDGYRYEAIADGYELKVFTCPVWVKDKQASLDLLTTSIVPNRLILVGEERGDCIPSVAAATVEVEGHNFLVSSESPGWLFIPMTNYPGWTARIDNTQAALIPANYLFMAVAVPEGQHYVQLTYCPEWLPGALIASGAAWFGLGLMAIYLRLKKWRTQDDS